MWIVDIRVEILELFRDAQSVIYDRVRARYAIRSHCMHTKGTCVICGVEFVIPPHATGLKIYCGSRCSMRQRNINRRGVPQKYQRQIS
jgi:hypothetical protein